MFINKKLIILLIYLILDYVFASKYLLICTDHDSYAAMFDNKEKQLDYISNIGLDRFHFVLIQIFDPKNYKEYFLQLHLSASLIFCFSIYNLREIINFTQTILTLLTPILFSIIYPHLWMCGYRQGISASILFLIYSYLYKQKYYSKKINIYYSIGLILFALNSHWSSLFFLPTIFAENIYNYQKSFFKKILNFKINKIFIIFFFSLVFIIFYLIEYTNSLNHLLTKFANYYIQDLFRSSYGVKIPKLLFFAYLPQIILHLRNKLIKNKTFKSIIHFNFFSLYLVFICSALSFVGIGGYLLRFYLPITLSVQAGNFINYNYFTKLGRISVFISSSLLFIGSVYYLNSISANLIPIEQFSRGLSKIIFN